jgi:hypothetical protein
MQSIRHLRQIFVACYCLMPISVVAGSGEAGQVLGYDITELQPQWAALMRDTGSGRSRVIETSIGSIS